MTRPVTETTRERTAEREYMLAAEPFITPVSGQVRREIVELADDRRSVILVVSNDDAMDVLEALRRAYTDGREDRGSEERPRTVYTHDADGAIIAVDARPVLHHPGPRSEPVTIDARDNGGKPDA